MLALRAVLAAAASTAAVAVHTALHGQLQEVSVDLAEKQDLRPPAEKDAEVPVAVPTGLEDRRSGPERAGTGPGGAAGGEGRRLWLSGKSRQALTNFHDVLYVGFVEVG